MSLSRNIWLIWFISSLYFSYEMFQLTSYSTIQDNLLAIYQISGWKVGLLSSAYLYFCAFFIIPAGILIDSYPTMPILAATLVLDILGFILMLSSEHYWLAVLGRGLTGIGNGFSFLGCMRLITDWFTEQKTAMVRGLTYTVGMFGCILSQTPYKLLIEKTSLHVGLLMNASFGMVLLFLMVLIIRQPEKARSKVEWSTLKSQIFSAVKDRQNILSGLYACIINLPLVLLGAFWGNRYLVENFSITYLQASKTTSLIFWGLMLGAPLTGWLSRHIKERQVLMCLSAIFASLLVLLMVMVPLSLKQTAEIFFLLGVLSSAQLVGYYVSAESSRREIEETSLGVVTTCINIGGAILQVIYGELIAYLQAKSVLAVLSIMFFLSIMTVMFLTETYGRNKYQ